MQDLRNRVANLLVRNRTSDMEPTCNVEEIDDGGYKTCIRGRLFGILGACGGRPSKGVRQMDLHGAPAGLEVDTGDLDGVFPQVATKEDNAPWDAMLTEYESFQNYVGIEEDDEAYTRHF